MSEDQRNSFISLVQEKRDSLYRIALSVTRNPQDAEDAAAMAIENCWRYLPAIRSSHALQSYLIRAAINAARSQLRKRKREVLTDDP